MPREFRFRIWHVGIMHSWSEIDDNFKNFDYSETYYMQYTGFRDKNEKRLYEGDILQDIRTNSRFKIIFKNGCFLLKPKYGKPVHFFPSLSYEDYEVIGNIYETPELLNEAN